MATDVSKVVIANLALSHLGKAKINSLSQAGAEATNANLFYPFARRSTLAKASWGFARARVIAGELTATWTERYEYAYQPPTDAVRIWRVTDALDPRWQDPADFPEMMDGAIHTNLSGARVFYIKDIDDPTKYTNGFVLTMAATLAAMLAIPLTRNSKLADTWRKEAARELSQAISETQNDLINRNEKDADWIEARS